MDIKDWASLVGAITGPAGLIVALLVYFRDRARVEVTLQWDMSSTDDRLGDRVATIKAANIGRRAIFLSHAHIKLPPGADQEFDTLLFPDSISGITLTEGAKPYIIPLNQKSLNLEKYRNYWWKLRATLVDTAGKKYHSDWPIARPSWADEVDASKLAIQWN